MCCGREEVCCDPGRPRRIALVVSVVKESHKPASIHRHYSMGCPLLQCRFLACLRAPVPLHPTYPLHWIALQENRQKSRYAAQIRPAWRLQSVQPTRAFLRESICVDSMRALRCRCVVLRRRIVPLWNGIPTFARYVTVPGRQSLYYCLCITAQP